MDNLIKKGRRFAVGDIHAEYEKLIDVLHQVNFDYNEDLLISLGDIVDRGYKTYECVEEVLKIKNLIAIRGNHDGCFRDSIITGKQNMLHSQGGRETMLSYARNCDCNIDPCKIPATHKEFFLNTQVNYYIDEENNLFVHGGFDRHKSIDKQNEIELLWDRDLFLAALSFKAMKNDQVKFKTKTEFNHIYIGHTPTIYWRSEYPITAANITNLDTGCGKGDYPLSMINLDTKEIIQSFK